MVGRLWVVIKYDKISERTSLGGKYMQTLQTMIWDLLLLHLTRRFTAFLVNLRSNKCPSPSYDMASGSHQRAWHHWRVPQENQAAIEQWLGACMIKVGLWPHCGLIQHRHNLQPSCPSLLAIVVLATALNTRSLCFEPKTQNRRSTFPKAPFSNKVTDSMDNFRQIAEIVRQTPAKQAQVCCPLGKL